MDFIQKLKIIKQICRLSQEKLARQLGVSFVTLNSWINGRSQPHPKKEAQVTQFYQKVTGQYTIPSTALDAKKKLLRARCDSLGGVLRFLSGRVDIFDQLLLSLTYHTNGIEGSTLSYNQTADIIFNNKVIEDKDLIEHLEAMNHRTAFAHLLKHLRHKGQLDEPLILRLHAILMNGIRDDAGYYRRHSVRIVGSRVVTANHRKVPDVMQQIEKEIRLKKPDPIAHITQTHALLEKTHPFADGNGRIGRLLIMGMLIQNNLVPAIIIQQKKQFYYTYLAKAQNEGDHSLLEDFMCDAIFEGLKIFE